jgi:SAM-dependent methyltransferase
MSETSKYLHITAPYCQGTGVDIGSQGEPVVPWAIQVDLPREPYLKYGGQNPESIHLPIGCSDLPFKDASLDFVYSSHLIEDFADWTSLLTEWSRIVKPGGNLVIMLPDKERFSDAIARGQPPNCAHQHEGRVGELSTYFPTGWTIIFDGLTNLTPEDYNILFVAKRL